jgi:TPR repeat protein
MIILCYEELKLSHTKGASSMKHPILQTLTDLYSKNTSFDERDAYLQRQSAGDFAAAAKELIEMEPSAFSANPNALFILGTFYLKGRGVEQDPKKAAILFERAANQNHLYAISNLGTYYLCSPPPLQNTDKAIELFTMAANQGLATAQSNLAICYYNGTGVEKNLEYATSLFELAAKEGDTDAIRHLLTLATIFKEGNDATEQDSSKASRCATSAWMHSPKGSPLQQKALDLITALQQEPGYNMAETILGRALPMLGLGVGPGQPTPPIKRD